MANTLKFGGGQWATKEGSTLAYNDENGNFKPLPFDFSRSTTATRVNKNGLIELVGSNEPRIDFKDDANGALLLEPQRTNLIPYSSEINDTIWTDNFGGTGFEPVMNSSTELAKDGTFSACEWVFNTGSGTTSSDQSSIFYNSTPTSVGVTYSFSVWVYSSLNNVEIQLRGAGSVYEKFTLTIGWNKITRIAEATSTSTIPIIGLRQSVNGTVNSNITVTLWGAQLEQGYATSYIPTNGSAVTRVAESCNGAGNEQVFNDSEGVLYVETKGFTDITPISKYIQLSKNGESIFNNSLVLQHRDNGSLRVYVNGTATANILFNENIDFSQNHKIAVLYKLNGYKLFIDGVEKNLSGTPVQTVFSGLNDFSFDNRGSNGWNGNIKEVKIYNTALTDTELQQLTTI